MSYRVEFLGIAETELDDAVEYYAQQKTNRSTSFIIALDGLIQHVLEHPYMFPKVKNELRKAVLKGFPYNIIYEIHHPDVILILAIAHQRKDPKRWIDR